MDPQVAPHRVAVVGLFRGPFVFIHLVNPPTHGNIGLIAVACEFVVPLVLIPDTYDFVVETEVVDSPNEVSFFFRGCGKWLYESKNRRNGKRRRRGGGAHG